MPPLLLVLVLRFARVAVPIPIPLVLLWPLWALAWIAAAIGRAFQGEGGWSDRAGLAVRALCQLRGLRVDAETKGDRGVRVLVW
jgi:hypothetical protein